MADAWENSSGGDWSTAGDWSYGVPSASTDAVIGVGGGYTVTILDASAQAGSLTIDNPGASLIIGSSGIAASLTIQHDFAAGSAFVEVEDGTLSVDGTMNVGTLIVGNTSMSAPATVTVGGMTEFANQVALRGNTTAGSANSATLDILDASTDIGGQISVGSNAVLSAPALLLQDESFLRVSAGGTVVGVEIGNFAEATVFAGGSLQAPVISGGSVEFRGGVAGGATVSFAAAAGTLAIDDLADVAGGAQQQNFNAAIAGLRDGDQLCISTSGLGNFTGIDAATPGAFNGTTTPLVLTSGGATVAILTLDGDYAGFGFAVSPVIDHVVTIGMQVNSPNNYGDVGIPDQIPGDVLYQNLSNGQLVYEYVANGNAESAFTASGALGNLVAVGHGDVNGDGISDIVVQDPNSGRIYIGEENGTANPTWVLGPKTPGVSAVGVGDIQGDDRADIVVQSAGGRIDYYDTTHDTFVSVANAPGWTVAGVGDVNGDGYADIVIQNQSNGRILYADMAGGVFNGWELVATDTQGWTVMGVADVTGDGYADVIVQKLTASGYSDVLAADMHGGVFNGWDVATTGLPSGYVVADTADVFDNGHADLIVQQLSTGNTYYAEEGANGFLGWGHVANFASNVKVV